MNVNDIIRLRPDLSEDKVQQIINSQNNLSASKNEDNGSTQLTTSKTSRSKAAWNHINWTLDQLPAAEAQLVSLDPNDGAIQAVVGGYDFSRSNFNRSMQGWRQPGSNIKPFI